MKFTVDEIKKLKLPAGKDDHTEYSDDVPGWLFRMRRTKKGANCYWQFEYAVGEARQTETVDEVGETKKGRKRRARRKLTYGRYPAMGVPQAREKAEKLHAETMLGADPQQMKEQNQRRAADTFEACVKRYLAWLKGGRHEAA